MVDRGHDDCDEREEATNNGGDSTADLAAAAGAGAAAHASSDGSNQDKLGDKVDDASPGQACQKPDAVEPDAEDKEPNSRVEQEEGRKAKVHRLERLGCAADAARVRIAARACSTQEANSVGRSGVSNGQTVLLQAKDKFKK